MIEPVQGVMDIMRWAWGQERLIQQVMHELSLEEWEGINQQEKEWRVRKAFPCRNVMSKGREAWNSSVWTAENYKQFAVAGA